MHALPIVLAGMDHAGVPSSGERHTHSSSSGFLLLTIQGPPNWDPCQPCESRGTGKRRGLRDAPNTPIHPLGTRPKLLVGGEATASIGSCAVAGNCATSRHGYRWPKPKCKKGRPPEFRIAQDAVTSRAACNSTAPLGLRTCSPRRSAHLSLQPVARPSSWSAWRVLCFPRAGSSASAARRGTGTGAMGPWGRCG